MKVELDEHAKMFVQAVLGLIGFFTFIWLSSSLDDWRYRYLCNKYVRDDQYSCVIENKYVDFSTHQIFIKCRSGYRVMDIPVVNTIFYDSSKADDTVVKIKGETTFTLARYNQPALKFNYLP